MAQQLQALVGEDSAHSRQYPLTRKHKAKGMCHFHKMILWGSMQTFENAGSLAQMMHGESMVQHIVSKSHKVEIAVYLVLLPYIKPLRIQKILSILVVACSYSLHLLHLSDLMAEISFFPGSVRNSLPRIWYDCVPRTFVHTNIYPYTSLFGDDEVPKSNTILSLPCMMKVIVWYFVSRVTRLW